MAHLFDSFTTRGVTLRNRIGISPMCQYTAENGFPGDWHLVHLGSRAVGGAGVVIAEATAVEPRGRISVADTGIWSDAHVDAWARITRVISAHGAVPAIQLAHAGRKAGWSRPWPTNRLLAAEEGGWNPVAPSPIPFNEKYPTPHALSVAEIDAIQAEFVAAARRSVAAGFEVIELHAAHGYLLNSFMSPISNHRTDAYGGSFAGRARMLLETTARVRAAIPDRLPLWVRISCSDWAPGGWTLDDSVELARMLGAAGADLIDCSSGGNSPTAQIPTAPGYQVPFAEAIRRDAGIATAAVGMITEARQAQAIVEAGQADVILVARQSLRDPYWPIRAAHELKAPDRCPPPVQYARGW